MYGLEYIRGLRGDSECIAALAWLVEHGFRYTTGGFTPPLTPRMPKTDRTTFVGLSLRIGRESRMGVGARITRIEAHNGQDAITVEGSDESIADGVLSRVFVPSSHGTLFVTSGKKRHALDVWLHSCGRRIVQSGYSIQPYLAGGAVAWLVVRKGRHKWTLTYFETMAGVPVSIGLGLADGANQSAALPRHMALSLYRASVAVGEAVRATFGVALAPTIGMTAMQCARAYLPADFQKWRPDPLLVALQREGRGYRGGLAYAQHYRGETVRVDITRQYTGALACELPRSWAFGAFPGHHYLGPGVYMCRVRLSGAVPYPLGVWQGHEQGFRMENCTRGDYVSVLHTPEIRAIIRAGGSVWPSYGFTARATFTLAGYVGVLQGILERYGRDHPLSRITKPLGNYVYGKLGQNPEQEEMMFSESRPGEGWRPYFDETGKAWDDLWTRETIRYSAHQHVDLAAYVTSLARAQTMEMWCRMLDSGISVLRCHTDSLTMDRLLPSFPLSNGDVIGGWRLESEYADTVVVGPNAYFDQDGAHIAGVSHPTYEMVERLYDGQVITAHRRMRKAGPLRGRQEGAESFTLRATATR
jgi:hypothetical protein